MEKDLSDCQIWKDAGSENEVEQVKSRAKILLASGLTITVMYSVYSNYTLYTALYSIEYTLHTIHYTLYTTQYTVYCRMYRL